MFVWMLLCFLPAAVLFDCVQKLPESDSVYFVVIVEHVIVQVAYDCLKHLSNDVVEECTKLC